MWKLSEVNENRLSRNINYFTINFLFSRILLKMALLSFSLASSLHIFMYFFISFDVFFVFFAS